MLYLFDDGQLSHEHLAATVLQADELKSFAFLTSEQITERTIPRLARRILTAAGQVRVCPGLLGAWPTAGEPSCMIAQD